MATPPTMQYKIYSVHDVAVLWGVDPSAVIGWLNSGALERGRNHDIDQGCLVRFVSVAANRALIQTARNS